MSISIQSIDQLSKLSAVLRAGSKARLLIESSLATEAFALLDEFARTHHVRIEVVGSSGERIVVFGFAGGALGIGLGYAVGGPIGALVGVAAGVAGGIALAHMHVQIRKLNHNEKSFFLELL